MSSGISGELGADAMGGAVALDDERFLRMPRGERVSIVDLADLMRVCELEMDGLAV